MKLVNFRENISISMYMYKKELGNVLCPSSALHLGKLLKNNQFCIN